jgi:CheY-like chemotaxis protein
MGVLGNASLAMAQLPDESPVKPIVEDIEAASIRASDLTNQLLAYAGRGSVTISKVDIAILVREMAKLLEVTISKNVALRYAFAENLPKIEGDVTQLRQLIMNLITNASDAIGERSGTITVSTSIIECDEEYLAHVQMEEKLKPGTYISLEVSDTGDGISDEAMQKILDPFFTTKPMGRGLGLATVHGIVRGHKGALNIYSEVGRGTTFKVLLRSAERSTVVKTRGKKKEDAKNWRGHGTVLIVDDEDIIREVSAQMIAALGFESITASSGWEALEIFKERKKDIQLVLLDEVMPRMDGEEVFTELRRISVVLCSGYTRLDATSRFAGKGLAGFIQKPFTLQLLTEELQVICEK